jgi:hypothetical protein
LQPYRRWRFISLLSLQMSGFCLSETCQQRFVDGVWARRYFILPIHSRSYGRDRISHLRVRNRAKSEITLGWWMSLKELVQLQKSLVSTEKTWRLHLILPHESKTPSLSRLWSHEDQAEYCGLSSPHSALSICGFCTMQSRHAWRRQRLQPNTALSMATGINKRGATYRKSVRTSRSQYG